MHLFPAAGPDPGVIRRRRARKADQYESCSRVPRHLSQLLMEHLDPIRCSPRRVLELGTATGHLRSALEARYPKAQVISADESHELMNQIGRPRWRRQRQTLACFTPQAIPLPAASVDLLVANLVVLPYPGLGAVFDEWHRVLRHGGLVLLCSLGPLSFQELVRAWSQVSPGPHIHPYPDMHDLGDALVGSGFVDVVVDSQRLTAEFDDVHQLLRELHTVGGGNAMPERCRGLTTPGMLRRLVRAYEAEPNTNVCRATVEAVFAHAWVMESRGIPVSGPVRATRSRQR